MSEASVEQKTFRSHLQQVDHFKFEVLFDERSWAPIIVDEPEPLGRGEGPNAARLLAGAVGNCLAASLLFCTDKARVPVEDLRAEVEGTMTRNENGRWRIEGIDVTLVPSLEGELGSKRFSRCVDLFEDFCVVTQSVRSGIDIDVRVEPTSAGSAESESEEPLAAS